MDRIPLEAEWSVRAFPASRRRYLESRISFEDIASSTTTRGSIVSAVIKPYRSHLSSGSRQVVFRLKVGRKNCDLFFNSADGMRGRYWRSPEIGDSAARHLVDLLTPRLMTWLKQNPPVVVDNATPMTLKEIEYSLACPTTKIWPVEEGSFARNGLDVSVWEMNEWENPSYYPDLWRWTPDDRDLEIKSALIDLKWVEYDPKRGQRAVQIHKFGFT